MKTSPLQVHLEESMHRRIKMLAKKKKITQSQLVREYLYRGLREDTADDDPGFDIIGMGSGSRTDTAIKHDQYLVAEEKAGWETEQ